MMLLLPCFQIILNLNGYLAHIQCVYEIFHFFVEPLNQKKKRKENNKLNQSLGSLSYTSNDILVNKQVFNFIINDKHETSLYSNRIKCSIAFDTNFFLQWFKLTNCTMNIFRQSICSNLILSWAFRSLEIVLLLKNCYTSHLNIGNCIL